MAQQNVSGNTKAFREAGPDEIDGLETRDPERLEIGEVVEFEWNLDHGPHTIKGEVVEKREVYNKDLDGYVTGATIEEEDGSRRRYTGHEAGVVNGRVVYYERQVREEPVHSEGE